MSEIPAHEQRQTGYQLDALISHPYLLQAAHIMFLAGPKLIPDVIYLEIWLPESNTNCGVVIYSP